MTTTSTHEATAANVETEASDATPVPFSLETTDLQPVNNGRRGLLIEASAGTGKTYTLERVVERVLSDECYALEPKHLLVVTFTRAATAELRQRLKQVLAKRAMAGGAALDDTVLLRARQAASRFDEATIVTIDGFWNLILNEYSLTLGEGSGVKICPDEKEVLREALRQGAETVLERRMPLVTISPETESLLFSGRLVPKLAELIEHPELVFEDCFKDLSGVAQAPEKLDAALVYETLVAATKVFDRIMREHGWVTYGEARRRVVSGVRRQALCEALRARFRCVLIDEFQDTDRAQLEVFRALFLDAQSTASVSPIVIFVGDPKQAIYRFRGADINAYLEARNEMAARAALPKNWRSAPELVRALNVLFDSSAARQALGSTADTPNDPNGADSKAFVELPFFTPVEPMRTEESTAHGLHDGTGAIPPVRMFAQTEKLECGAGGNNEAVLRRMTAEILLLLKSAKLPLSNKAGDKRALHPGDFAVLVRSNTEAKAAAKVLDEAGLPVSANTDGNIFARPEALELLEVLHALASPGDYRKFTAAALGTVGGLTPAEVVASPANVTADEHSDEVARRLHALERRRAFSEALAECLDVLARSDTNGSGLYAALSTLFDARSLKARLLRKPDGRERIAVFEKLARRLDEFHSVLGLEGCVSVLEGRIRDALTANPNDEVAPEDAMPVVYEGGRIRVMTMHKSKGLEFPVVLIPFAELPEHGIKASSLPVSAVAGEIAPFDRAHAALVFGGLPTDPQNPTENEIVAHLTEREIKEQMDEELRLLYVAMTRAKSHLILFTRAYGKEVRCALDVLLTGASSPSGNSNGIATTTLEHALGLTHPVLAWKFRQIGEALLDVVGLNAEDFPEEVPTFAQPVFNLENLSVLTGLDQPLAKAMRRSSFTGLVAANPPTPLPSVSCMTSSEVQTRKEVPAEGGARVGVGGDMAIAKGFDDELDESGLTDAVTDEDADDLDTVRLKTDEFEVSSEKSVFDASTGADDDVVGFISESDPRAETELPPELRLPRGADAGTAMHELFEQVDFVTYEMPGGVSIEEAASRAFERTMGSVSAEAVGIASDLVRAALRVRFAEHAGKPFALHEVPRNARRSEMGFTIRVAKGVTARYINAALSAYDPAYAFTTTEGATNFDLGGFLTGSIDLAFTQAGKWWIVDWKSNIVATGPHDLPITRDDVSREMKTHRYHLQYLLYLVAYRRWLRGRWAASGLGSVEIERLIEATYGGVYYVFVRWLDAGQEPSGSGSPAGLYYARPTGAFLDALDALLDGRGLPEGNESAALAELARRFAALRDNAEKAARQTNSTDRPA